MLTSLYYYDHYRPYIVKTENGNAGVRKLTAKEPTGLAPAVALNKALNVEIVKYARDIYRNTTDLKHVAKKLESDINNYVKYRDFDEFDQEVFDENFNNDLLDFSDSYNKSLAFLRNQQHSEYFGQTADELENIVYKNKELLSNMGIEQMDDGSVQFVHENNSFVDSGKILESAEQTNGIFREINEAMTEILNDPMSKHMNFKSLNYYYNYKVDKVHVDSFQIVKTGLLVNLAL